MKKYVILIFLCVIAFGGALIVTRRSSQGVLHSSTGTVTSKFTDCVGGEEMDSKGKIFKIKSVSCDGGSTITIDYKDTFVTTSGFVLEDESFTVDVSSIKVGDRATVKYTINADGHKTLHCDTCSVTKL